MTKWGKMQQPVCQIVTKMNLKINIINIMRENLAQKQSHQLNIPGLDIYFFFNMVKFKGIREL
jgi:hypothetical protein